VDEVRLEVREHPRAALQNGDLATSTSGEMRELGRDVAAADEHDARRQDFEIQELLTCHEVLFAWKVELRRFRSGGDEKVRTFKRFATDRDGVGANEAGFPVIGCDAALGEAPIALFWDGIGEAALEGHQA